MRSISIFFLVVLVFGCKKKQAPSPPDAAMLVHPAKNSECTTGTDLNNTTTEVEFSWNMAEFTDTYELRVTNVMANTTQTISTAALFAKLPLNKGELYSWQVTTKNDNVLESTSSETWQFYNAGFETTYAPFPAVIISPEPGASVFADNNDKVNLEWQGTDIENDIQSFEVYFSTENPPATIVETLNASTNNLKVEVEANTVYYWKVVIIDREGNQSDSGVFDFRSL